MPPTENADIAQRDALADRLRTQLADEPSLVEKAMFGSRAFLVREKLVACAFRGGDLLIRVDADREDELLGRPGATHAVMAGRDMGAGWLLVDAEAIVADDALVSWLEVALDHNRVTTASP